MFKHSHSQHLQQTAMMSRNISLCVLLFSLFSASSLAQDNYVAFELERGRDRNWEALVTEDLNGDGALDLIVSNFQEGIGRELLIYHQQPDGSFSPSPQRIEIKTEIIAVSFADLRTDPGKELLLFANTAVFSLSSAKQGYANNLKLLLEWDLIAGTPDLEIVQFIDSPVDINGDGLVDLLIPGEKGYGYFENSGAESFTLVSRFTTINEQLSPAQRERDDEFRASIEINAEQGLLIDFSTQINSAYTGFVEQWNSEDSDSSTLLETENWMPTAILALVDSDELLDIVYINIGDDRLGQINIHYQHPENGFNEQADWTGSIDTQGDIQLADINQDQRIDIVRTSGSGNDWTARLFVNQDGRFNLERPNQIMRFSGYDVRLNFIPLEVNETPILNVSYYTIPVVDVIRNASIKRVQLMYRSDQAETGQLFNRRPDARLEESFSAENVQGLAEQMTLSFDVDGNGRRDALYITENGTLAAKAINQQTQIEAQAFWEYVAPRAVFEFEVLDLNSDARPDLILRHDRSTTILVATP